MVQTSFNIRNNKISEETVQQLKTLLKKQFEELQNQIPNRVVLDEILKGRTLTRSDHRFMSKPEDVTEQTLITPIFRFLGYVDNRTLFISTGSKDKERESDYTLVVNGEKVLVEAEPIGKDLYSNKHVGVGQLEGYLEKKSFKSQIGIASNGYTWVLCKYNDEKVKLDIIKEIDLRPVLYSFMGQNTLGDTESILENFCLTFSQKTIIETAKELEIKLDVAKREISKKFYEDYVKYVFGVTKEGSSSYGLIDGILGNNLTEVDKRKFAVTFMNRLIFIKFLEDRVLSRPNLLKDLLDNYNNMKESLPGSTFYEIFLKPLFYGVFNTSRETRDESIRTSEFFADLPYLNGGLFRENMPNESSIKVKDDIVTTIINELLLSYNFSITPKGTLVDASLSAGTLDPDILGYVFEKTINFLTSPGIDNRRKLKGAYYTPDQITKHMTEQAIFYKLLSKIKEGLKDCGWVESDIERFNTIEDVTNFPPTHQDTIKRVMEKIDELKVLDPACGSGHFLTNAMKLIVYVRKMILKNTDQEVDAYELKRRTVSYNLYGVDIEEPAVEIAKLRVWLSMIEEINVENVSSIKTLPNIEYNIIVGDSLIGWNDEVLIQTTVENLMSDSSLRDILITLEVAYVGVTESRNLLRLARKHLSEEYPKLEDVKKAYGYLKKIYTLEQGERAVLIKDILEKIKARLLEFIIPMFEEYINQNYEIVLGSHSHVDAKNGVHWSLNFVEAMSNGGFDVVIGNPPYGYKFDKTPKKYLRAKFKSSSQNGNSAMMFIERSIDLLKEDGYLCFIVPKSLAYSQRWVDGRHFVLKHLIWTIDVSKAFQDVKLEQMIIGMIKNSNTESYENERIGTPYRISLKKDILDLTDTILFSGSKGELDILKKMNASNLYFRNVSHTKRGLPLQSKLKKTVGKYEVIRGRDIGRFTISNSQYYLDDADIIGHEEEVRGMISSEKIVSQRIVAHIKNPVPHLLIMSAVDRGRRVNVDTVENTYILNNKLSPDYLVALLNSELISWYCYHFVFSNAIRSMDLDDYYIGKIPLPSDKKKIDEILKFLSENKEQLAFDVHLKEKMDDLINEAYRLTQNEKKLIKEGISN